MEHLVLALVGVPDVELFALTVRAYPVAVFTEIHGCDLPRRRFRFEK